ncbi:TOMM precursor leader peptide-binding protein [Gloeothece verrucosa]|uniref:YcaO domain-containing protein n=1 Tax=Gloeothece verrucosa (strain PCC 7822) TaxID=497965 RepID=E0ULZ4_GLOV7|nr:TOMM precursor leader peptide-binding protein [Gloeothece verrucosa]ADN17974.1 protein of unknown function DUF181 [Gloeothece verrucosa PCC 7822]
MLNKPSLRVSLKFETTEQDKILLLSERASSLLEGHLYQLIIPLIDGHRTVDEIIQLVQNNSPNPIPSSYVYYILMDLEKKGYIVENQDYFLSNWAVFCDGLNLNLREVQNKLEATKVAVKSIGSVPASALISILQTLQIAVSNDENGELEVILADDYLCNELDIINQQKIKHSRPWMLIKPLETLLWIGPIFQPGKTGCWECLAQRIRGNKPIESFLQKRQKTSSMPPLASLPSTEQIALNIAATEIFKWIVRGRNEGLEGRLLTYDTFSLNTKHHVLTKRPQCPCCGDPSLMTKPLSIILGSRQKTFTTDGGHRHCPPEETLKKYQHHISPLTGVIRNLKKISLNSKDFTHIYRVEHHYATMFDSFDDLRKNLGGISSGKGKTDLQAQVSGLGEGIERYSGVFQGDEPREKKSYQQLRDKAIHPNACMNFSPEQYKNWEAWNATHPSYCEKIPYPFDEGRSIDWTPVWSLTHQEFRYLPTAYCYFGYPKPPKPDCWADSNGCAAGNTLEEAILQGFMELVERDCVALWWYNRIKKPEVNLESFEEPYFQNLKHYYQILKRDLWVLDITSDFNIPAFAAISRRIDQEIEDIIYGFGAHLEPKIAISRALTEVNQNLMNVGTANADGSTRYPVYSEPLALNWWKTATIKNQPYLAPDPQLKAKTWRDYPQVWSNDLLDDVRTCQQLVEAKGMEMLVLDQTRPDIGLKVVKVIVPGMCHFWRRLGSDRLYRVPVQVGWLKEASTENQLNFWSIWI